MCDPMTIALVGMQVGTIAMQHKQQADAAKLQNAAYEQNRLNATTSLMGNYQQAQERQRQEIASASNAIQQRRMEEMRQGASARAAAGEAGISGFSVDALLRDVSAVGARDVMNTTTNRDWSLTQLNHEMRGARASAENQINSMRRGQKPSALATAFRIGSAGLNGYAGAPQS